MKQRLEPGERGEVYYEAVSAGWRAVQYYRDNAGRRRKGTGVGKTKDAARRTAKRNIDAAIASDGETFKKGTLLEVAVREWLKTYRTLVADGSRAPTTLDQYERYARVEIYKTIGRTRISDLTTGRVDQFIADLRGRKGFATAKAVRSILNGTCGMLVRRDVLRYNPVRDVARLEQGRRNAPRALSIDEAARFLAMLDGSEFARRRDLPDLMRFLLATGVRIGEALALRWSEIDLDAQVVQIDWTVTRVKGRGLVRSPVKTETSERSLQLPIWCVEILRRRAVGQAPDALVFTDAKGGLRDVGNTGKDLRKARGEEFAWVKSHTARRTVATLLDVQGLSARAIADQLGHARPSMTQDVYMGRKIVGQVTSPLDGLFASTNEEDPTRNADTDGDAA
ncbi:site-specific recombinase XerC [Promicromonospora sp. AC04]|uniref:site-specific integrase n=1 Tax=Promicromonospora sp. AC04 TaxID=2135723 RepID=UPI000D3ABED4|nr:site-specific integrase [Promicromonospora sp. AC04]PUB23977.1 site-specific recombinase XerC [Promicromonospora sp. AC04]